MLDITDLAHPDARVRPAAAGSPQHLPGPNLCLRRRRPAGASFWISRIPTQPKIDQIYNAGGCINDLCDVKLGITYTSEFAYLADGCNGMRIVQLTSPDTPGNQGFSPRPTPQLIAGYPVAKGGRALAIAKGLDRDRAVDESGNQISVFGRIGARPLNLAEQRRLYLRNGWLWTVSDDPWDDEVYRHHPPKPEALPVPAPLR